MAARKRTSGDLGAYPPFDVAEGYDRGQVHGQSQ